MADARVARSWDRPWRLGVAAPPPADDLGVPRPAEKSGTSSPGTGTEEVLAGIVDADPFSFVRTEPGWLPVLPSESGTAVADGAPSFTMGDLLRYAVPDDGRRFARDGG